MNTVKNTKAIISTTANMPLKRILIDFLPEIDNDVKGWIESEQKADRRVSQFGVECVELAIITKLVQSVTKHLKDTDELGDFMSSWGGKGYEVIATVIRDGKRYQFNTECIIAGGYNIQVRHYRYIVKTDLPKEVTEMTDLAALKAANRVNNKKKGIASLIDAYTLTTEKYQADYDAKKIIVDAGRDAIFTEIKRLYAEKGRNSTYRFHVSNWASFDDAHKAMLKSSSNINNESDFEAMVDEWNEDTADRFIEDNKRTLVSIGRYNNLIKKEQAKLDKLS